MSKSEQNLIEKSLPVLRFVSLSQDPTQEYFADGITENILIQLAGIPQLRVISRTSVMRYKKPTNPAPEIATELGEKFILEGSAQAHGKKVRINVQLIDALKDQHLWSKVFVESMDDIFEIQNNVAEVVAKELISSFTPKQHEKLKEIPTKNLEAYDLFLKGRHAFNQWSVDGYRTASEYFKQAIAKDPEFKQAYSYLASSYSARMSWNGDLSPEEARSNIEIYLNEAWKRGPSDNDYLTKAFVEFFIAKDFQTSEKLLLQAIELKSESRFGRIGFEGDRVTEFFEKPESGEGWINGGFFVLSTKVLDFIDGDDTVWERDPVERLAHAGEMMGFKHYGFWSCMDTLKEKSYLEELWNSGKAPWKVW